MRDLRLSAARAGLVSVCGLVNVPNANAATIASPQDAPGSVRQLSNPATNTGAGPKSTGFRNESTTPAIS